MYAFFSMLCVRQRPVCVCVCVGCLNVLGREDQTPAVQGSAVPSSFWSFLRVVGSTHTKILRKAAWACALVSQPPPIGHPGASPFAPCAKGVVSAAVSPPAPHGPRPIADIPFPLMIGVIADRFARGHGAGPVPTTMRACERMARAEVGWDGVAPGGHRTPQGRSWARSRRAAYPGATPRAPPAPHGTSPCDSFWRKALHVMFHDRGRPTHVLIHVCAARAVRCVALSLAN